MNRLFFSGRAASDPDINTHGSTTVTRLRMISNEYAGKDEDGQRKERQVSIPFSAFGKQAETIAKTVSTGDQLVIEANIRNNNYTDGEGKERYEYNFEIVTFEYGAKGKGKGGDDAR